MIRPINLGLKLSARHRIPVVQAFDTEFWPHQFISFLWRTRGWHIIEKRPDYLIYKIGKYRIKLLRTINPVYNSSSYAQSFFKHYFDWMKEYRPPFPLKGKTVLEGGSGCGETIMVFALMGATKFICIDNNPEACQVLLENAEANGWDVDIINEPFTFSHLSGDWDFCKLDVEGGEKSLLYLDELPDKPIVMETHGAQLTHDLVNKFHLKIHKVLTRKDGEVTNAISRNY